MGTGTRWVLTDEDIETEWRFEPDSPNLEKGPGCYQSPLSPGTFFPAHADEHPAAINPELQPG